jgi:beta-N-acetylhexosaminidase
MAPTSHILLRQQVGQLMIIGFDGTEADPRLRSLLTELQPAGVILFTRNIVSPRQCFDLVQECRSTAHIPLFTCIDLEGGTVDRFRHILAPAPSQFDVASTGKKSLFRKHGEILGESARALGFNVDFAPVSDLGFAASRSVLGSRTVSDDAKETIAFVEQFLRGLRSSGVFGCGKHFPGLGEANLDSHHSLPVIDKAFKAMWTTDLLPYRKLRKQLPFVMVAHAAYPSVTKDNIPASLSKKWMTDILRKKIGYSGMILSDDMEMGGVLAAAPIGEACVRTFQAGADMLLVCHKEENVRAAYEAIIHQAEIDKNFAKQIAATSARVLGFKMRSKQLRKSPPAPTPKTIAALVKNIEQFKKAVAKAHGISSASGASAR